jgi:solute carrier family 39 (zinc transporter), member 1/2/3
MMLGVPGESSENLVDGRSPSLSATSISATSPLPPVKLDADEDGNDSDLELDELVNEDDAAGLLNGAPKIRDTEQNGSGRADGGRSRHAHADGSSDHQNQQRLFLQVLLLEAGILFHSVFIGMAVSVATGTPFMVLLVAISFHQTFEGFALGARIAQIQFPLNSIKPWLMALAYGTTTPAGQALGLLLHRMYDPASQTGLLTVGTMNAISSGLLLYAGLVTLLAEDFLSEDSYKTLRGRRRLEACAAVVSGAGLMALVGAWA